MPDNVLTGKEFKETKKEYVIPKFNQPENLYLPVDMLIYKYNKTIFNKILETKF